MHNSSIGFPLVCDMKGEVCNEIYNDLAPLLVTYTPLCESDTLLPSAGRDQGVSTDDGHHGDGAVQRRFTGGCRDRCRSGQASHNEV